MKTAVEQLLYYLPNSIKGQFKEQIEQAKEMEKEQIRKSFSDGAQWEIYGSDLTHEERSEEYYNEIFKQEQ
jgi:hypothetical protein